MSFARVGNRMKKSRELLIVFLALLLVPTSVGEAVEFTSNELTAKKLEGVGAGAAVKIWGGNGTEISLTAERVQVVELTEVHQGRTAPGGIFRPNSTYKYYYHNNIVWSGSLDTYQGSVLVAQPKRNFDLQQSTYESTSLVADAAIESAWFAPFQNGESWSTPVESLLQTDSGYGKYVLRGNYTIYIWSGGIKGFSEDSYNSYVSKNYERSVVSSPAGPVLKEDVRVFLTLYVQNGTLSFDVPASASARSYMDGVSLLTPDQGRLYGAIGTIGNRSLTGVVPLEDGQPLLVSAAGQGLYVKSPPPIQTNPDLIGFLSTSTVVYPILLPLAVLGIAGIALFVRTRYTGTVRSLLDHMDQKEYRRVVRKAGPVMRRTGSNAVAVMKTVALLVLGRSRAALRFLDRLPEELRPADGMDSFLRAHALNELGEEDQARTYLTEALTKNPDLQSELAQFPRLRRLLPEDGGSGVYA